MEPRKILLVDDDDHIRLVARLTASKVGNWDVVVASGGGEALEKARGEAPDLIILDVMMPEMDGPTTLRKLREEPATAGIPVIFLTAKVQDHEVEGYLELGAVGVIRKPFDPMELPNQIRRIVAPL